MRIILALMLVFSAVASAEIYKWTDENGQVHFGDRPTESVKAETVEIREQKTGSMVSESQKKQWKADATTKKYQNHPVNSLPATSAGKPNRACDYAKNVLNEYRIELAQLRKRGYKQYEKVAAEDAIELWEAKVKTSCAL